MNRKLAKEIQKMAILDQKVRKQQNVDAIVEVTKRNTKRLKEIVEQFGWPTILLVGPQASNSAWLLIQHADHDLKFQKYCLQLMREAAQKGGVLWENVAYLTDRVLINSGKPQLYGTQFYSHKDRLFPKPIKDPDKLDIRRKQMGLQPFKIYKREMFKFK